jgi:hypothetical protein
MSKTKRIFAASKLKNPYADDMGGPIKGKEMEFFTWETKSLSPAQIEQTEVMKRREIKKS